MSNLNKNPLNVDIDTNVKLKTVSEIAEFKYSTPFKVETEYTPQEGYFQTQDNPTQLLTVIDGKYMDFPTIK